VISSGDVMVIKHLDAEEYWEENCLSNTQRVKVQKVTIR